MNLETAVDATSETEGKSKPGLKALRSNSQYIKLENTRKCTRSLDIDEALAAARPTENRWDYIVEYNSQQYFVEVHPASTSEIDVLLKKLAWLKQWLLTVPALNALPKGKSPYRWAATGKVNILPGSSHARRLAASGLKVERPVAIS